MSALPTPRPAQLRLGDRTIGDGHPTYVIAEGCDNHLGDMGRAREMIHAAAEAGADAIKFQHHLPDEEMLRDGVPTTPNFEEPLYDFLLRCALTLGQHEELAAECEAAGITYLCTPFSARAAEEIAPLGVPAFKIGSGELTDLPSLARIAALGVPLICSTGMATLAEIDATVAFLSDRVVGLALLNCTSAYPTAPSDVALGVIGVLRDRYGLVVGHSDHTPAIWTAVGSVVAGARIVEKHFTLDHALPGPDRDVSIDPAELRQLVEGVRQVEVALGAEKLIRPEEAAIREWAHRSVVTVRPVAEGARLGVEDLATKRPGTGIPAARLDDVVGRIARRALPADHLVGWDDLVAGDGGGGRALVSDAPVAVLAGTGFTARTLVLGGFAEAVARARPVVAYVRRPDLVEATGVVPAGVELRTYPDPARFESDSALAPSELAFEAEAAIRRTEAMRLLARIDRRRRSRRERVVRGALAVAAPVLRRPEVRRRTHERYLAWARTHPETRAWVDELGAVAPAAIVTSRLTLGLCRPRTVDGDLAAHLAASELGIAHGTLVQSWDNLTSKPAIVPEDIDRWWLWSELQVRDLGAALPGGVPAGVEVVGSPAFDAHADPTMRGDRAATAEALGLDPARPWIVVGGGNPRAMPHEPEVVAAVLAALWARRPDVQVVLRPHPKARPDAWTQLPAGGRLVLQTADPEVALDDGGLSAPEEYFGPLLSTLAHAAAVVCTGSTLLVDAAAVDTPGVTLALDLGRDEQVPEGRSVAAHRTDHIRLVTDSGAVAVARSVEEAVVAIEDALEHPERRRSARARLTRAIIGPHPGRAGAELAARVLDLAAAGPGAPASRTAVVLTP